MKTAVIVFPGSNCDRDIAVALREATGRAPQMVWHKETSLPSGTDCVAIPGGFSFGDYLRCGAIAARSPVMDPVRAFVEVGGVAIGICNGFQVLIESGLLPGALMRNAGLTFICKDAALRVETTASPFTSGYMIGDSVTFPVAHHDGNYFADTETLACLTGEDRVAFRYEGPLNGSTDDIAGILSPNRRVLGLMPHPERAADAALGRTDGTRLFQGLTEGLMAS